MQFMTFPQRKRQAQIWQLPEWLQQSVHIFTDLKIVL